MDLMKKGGSTSRPPFLDGTNYGYWKARMRSFIKSIDEKAWRLVIQGWEPPTKTYAEGKTVPKSEVEWTPEEDALSTQNSRGLNAIFNGVDLTQFKMISTAEVTKEAWDILQVAFEGTDAVL